MLKFDLLFFFSFFYIGFLMSQNPTKLIYFGDPMCSWCYGFSPELSKTVANLGNDIPIEIVMGGLRPYNQQKMIELKSFLTDHWQEVNHRSHQKFSYGILNDENIAYDTEPPSRALVIIRELCPGDELTFFKNLQKQFYVENKNMNLLESYYELIEGLGISKEEFAKQFNSEEYKLKVKEDFARSSSMGVRSFPTLLLQKGDELFLIAQGYLEAEKVINSIKAKL